MDSPDKLLLLEPDLVDFAGHYFGYVSELAAAAQRRNIPLVIVCNRNAAREVIARLEALGARVEARFHRLSWFRLALASSVLYAVTGIAAVRRYPDHLPITLSGRLPLLLGAAACAAVSPGLSIFQIMSWQHRLQARVALRATPILRLAARLGHRAGLRFACETESLQPILSTFLDQPVEPLPTIAPWPEFAAPRTAARAAPRVGILGAGRWEKNLAQFVEAVRPDLLAPGQAGPKPLDCRLVVQVDATYGSYAARCAEILSCLRNSPQDVEIIEEPMRAEDFTRLLAGLDVIAMPNQPSVAATAASGIFTQSLGLGVVPVVPAGTWMAAQAKREGLGVIYDEYTSYGLRRGIEYAIANRNELATRIRSAAEDWRRRHSADTMLDRLLAIGSGGSTQ